MRLEDVTAVLVTRGDVDLTPILASLPYTEVIIWDNTRRSDVGTFGRFVAIQETRRPVIYFQDDDCIVAESAHQLLLDAYDRTSKLVVNMPEAHGQEYPGLSLLGWGSLIRRDLPFNAFRRYARRGHKVAGKDFFNVGCDIICSVLTPSIRLDLGHEDLAYAHAPGRSHLESGYWELKRRYYDEARAVILRGLRYDY